MVNNRLLFRAKITSAEALSCIFQVAGAPISTKDAKRLLISVYNEKIAMCSSLKNFISMNDFSLVKDKKEVANKALSRTKRWFFTYSLSKLTGLADDSVVSSLSKETQQLLKVGQQEAEEIVNLDKKSNEILAFIEDD
jgi:vacuolar-type H+-ATPase subunit I/STV1